MAVSWAIGYCGVRPPAPRLGRRISSPGTGSKSFDDELRSG
jgi:hypothetical protein